MSKSRYCGIHECSSEKVGHVCVWLRESVVGSGEGLQASCICVCQWLGDWGSKACFWKHWASRIIIRDPYCTHPAMLMRLYTDQPECNRVSLLVLVWCAWLLISDWWSVQMAACMCVVCVSVCTCPLGTHAQHRDWVVWRGMELQQPRVTWLRTSNVSQPPLFGICEIEVK